MTKYPVPNRFGSLVLTGLCMLIGLMSLFAGGVEAWRSLVGEIPWMKNVEPVSFWTWVGFLATSPVLFFGGWIFYSLGVEYLLIGPQGIEKHGLGFVYRTTWDNIECVGLLGRDVHSIDPRSNANTKFMLTQMRAQPGKILPAFANLLSNPPLLEGTPEGLVLRRPISVEKKPWGWGITRQVIFIDLSSYPHWRHSLLGQEVRRYAPHLLNF